MRFIAAPLHLFRPIFTALLCATLLAGNSYIAAAADARRPEFVEGEILISFQDNARPEDVRAILRDLDAKPMRKFRRTKAERHKIAKPVPDAVAKYKNHPAVRFIEPNYILRANAVPNDASFPLQWSLQNTGQQGGTPGSDIHVIPAWDQTTGSSSVVIAIIDTGMDMAHPDLAANLYTNPGEVPGNGQDDDGNGLVDDVHGFDFANFDGDPSDDNGHGTHVAGTIGAVGNNAIGIAGVAWRVQLLPLKFLDLSGSGTTSDAVDCIDYAVDAGATAINASWGGPQEALALRFAIAGANNAGVLFVAAAGNTSSNNDAFPNFPSSFELPNIISVGSSARSDERSGFSNYGPGSVDLFAPGTQILSTLPNKAYGQASGTSMATPHVVGALALLKSRFPTMRAPTMKAITLAATDRVAALAGLSVTGGRLNVVRMLEGVDSIAPARVADLAGILASSDRITVRWTATGDDGATGIATLYDIRVSTTPIDAANFASATRVSGVAFPRVAGTREEAAIRGLTPLTDYYAAIVVFDEFGNVSPLSNVIQVRTTAPPVAAVQPASLAQELRTGERAALTLDVRNDGAGVLDFTARVLGSGGGAAPSWISIAPAGGSSAAGAHAIETVTLSASGLRGGDYAALARFSTNDPTHPTLDVPVSLHVISAPDIDVFPVPITFGPVAIGGTDIQSLLVTNAGFADLHVTRVFMEGADYTVDNTPFDLPPGAATEIYVSVTPTTGGAVLGTLTIECDDPDEPVLRIPVGASGIVPAAITVAPNRESASLHTGQTAEKRFTIGNTGGSTLSWTVRVRAAGSLAFDSTGAQVEEGVAAPPARPDSGEVGASRAGASQTADLSDVRILFDSHRGASSGAWSGFISSLVSRGALFALNTQRITAGVLDGADVYWISDGSGPFTAAERGALAAWVRGGGSLLIEGDELPALPEFDALLDSLSVPVSYVPGQGITGSSTRLFPYEVTRGATAVWLPSSTARLQVEGPATAVLIEDATAYPAMAASFVGRGRVLVVAGRLFADVSAIFPDNRMIATQSLDWLGGVAWLAVTPSSGITTPGQTSTVTARFDGAQLAGAEYRAAIVFRSNDPARTDFLVPVDLSLTPASDVSSSPAQIDFGPVFVGAVKTDSVVVRNVGVAPLRVTSVAVNHPEVVARPETLSLTPGASGAIVLVYTPVVVGPLAGAELTLGTDDPDEPEIKVPLAASGSPAPDIDIGPASVSASLTTGANTTRPITIANRVGSDLQFSIRFQEEAPTPAGATAAAAGAPRAAALPRTWDDARAAAVQASGRVKTLVAPPSLHPASVDTLPLVVADMRGDGGVVDLLVFRASARGGFLNVEMTTAGDFVPLNFGGYVSLDVDQNPNTGRDPSFGHPRQDTGVEYEIGLFSIGFGYVDLFDAHSGSYQHSFPVVVEPRAIRFSIPLSWLGHDEGRMNMSGVVGNALGPSDWFPNHGHGTIGGLWVVATPAAGTVAAGAEFRVTLALDARGLRAAVYRGSVIVESNDPDEPVLSIAAQLTVADGPLIEATATRVHLGDVFLGRSSEGEVIVSNAGTAPLSVSSSFEPSGLADFTASPASFTVLPGGTQPIHLTFTPSAEGAREGTLTFTHDAPGDPVFVSVTGVGLAAPALQVATAPIEARLALGDSTVASFQIRNNGGSSLNYGVEAMNGAPAVAVHEALFVDRDAEDPRPGLKALGNGGPDAFGYRWVDSNQPGGPIFNWQEISATGTPVPIRLLDQNSGPLPIGFAFPFYDRVFTTFNVCTHGWISFTDTTVTFGNQPLPTTGAPANMLAAFWDDLNFAGVEHAFYHSDGTRLIVEYSGVARRQRGGPFTFQIILYPSGAIVYQYLLMGVPVTSGTIGIQNRTKSDGLTVVFDEEYLRDGMAIRFSAAPSWLSVPQRFGSLEPGESTSVAVALRARGLFAGAYQGSLRVSSNDPDRTEAIVPVSLRALGIPRLTVAPASLRFDTLLVGDTEADSLRITNTGNDRLEVTSITSDSPDFTVTPAFLSVGAQQDAIVRVRYQPSAAGDRSASIAFSSDDPVSPVVTVLITAAAFQPRRELAADVTPSAIQRGSKGKQVRARVLMPADLDAARVLLPGVRLQGTVPLDLADTRVRDLNGDGRADLDLAFARDAVERALPEGSAVPLVITGEVQGVTQFAARDTIRVTGKRFAAAGIEVEEGAPPAVSALHANAPNPFGAATAFRFDLASSGAAALRVYAADGRLVRTLLMAPLPAGRFRGQWDGRDDRNQPAPSGVYFARMEVGGPEPFRAVRRWIRVR